MNKKPEVPNKVAENAKEAQMTVDPEMPVTITAEEVLKILKQLAELPYRHVANVIGFLNERLSAAAQKSK